MLAGLEVGNRKGRRHNLQQSSASNAQLSGEWGKVARLDLPQPVRLHPRCTRGL